MPETAASSSAQGTDVSGSQTPGLDTPDWRDEFKVWSVAADELIEGVFASGKLVGACETGGLAAGVVAEDRPQDDDEGKQDPDREIPEGHELPHKVSSRSP